MNTFLYVYGTLRPGQGPTVLVPGVLYSLPNCGFPGAKAVGQDIPEQIVCEKIPVEKIEAFDRYEGYNPEAPENSLYIRVPYLDGFIYEYNRPTDSLNKIASGDWLEFERQGG